MTGVKTTREGQASARNQSGSSGPDGSITADGSARSERRAHLVVLAGELFAQKGYRATTVREIADAAAIEQIVRSTSLTLARHRAALAMLQNDWSYFAAQPRFAYLPKALREIERIWVSQLEAGKESGLFRADLDTKLTYRLLRDVLWIPEQWRRTRGYSTDQVVDAFLRILFEGIANRA